MPPFYKTRLFCRLHRPFDKPRSLFKESPTFTHWPYHASEVTATLLIISMTGRTLGSALLQIAGWFQGILSLYVLKPAGSPGRLGGFCLMGNAR